MFLPFVEVDTLFCMILDWVDIVALWRRSGVLQVREARGRGTVAKALSTID